MGNETITGGTGKEKVCLSNDQKHANYLWHTVCALDVDLTDQTLYWRLVDFIKLFMEYNGKNQNADYKDNHIL
jgi:hypothetical protein